jgi:hypothetical protein
MAVEYGGHRMSIINDVFHDGPEFWILGGQAFHIDETGRKLDTDAPHICQLVQKLHRSLLFLQYDGSLNGLD